MGERKLSTEDIYRKVMEGLTYSDIAREYGISRQRVSYLGSLIDSDHKIKLKNKLKENRKKYDREYIVNFILNNNYTIKEVSQELNINYQSLLNIIYSYKSNNEELYNNLKNKIKINHKRNKRKYSIEEVMNIIKENNYNYRKTSRNTGIHLMTIYRYVKILKEEYPDLYNQLISNKKL